MTIIDFTDTIIAKSDQLNAADIAGEMTITITEATKKKGDDQPIAFKYEGGEGRPWKPCKSMRRLLAQAWGNKVDVAGRKITLVCDPTVTWAGQEVGGIRIKALSHIAKPMSIPLRASKTKVVTVKVDVIPTNTVGNPLKKAGDDAASKGIDAYTKWLASLTPEQKSPLKQYHSAWTTKAKSVIIEVAAAKEEANEEETLAWE
jgi:hypothetical protein